MSERWLLITVTADGQVNTSRHRTKEEAEIAGSLARYGMTPEELASAAKQSAGRDSWTSGSYIESAGQWADFVSGVGYVIRNRSSVKEYRIIHEADEGPAALREMARSARDAA